MTQLSDGWLIKIQDKDRQRGGKKRKSEKELSKYLLVQIVVLFGTKRTFYWQVIPILHCFSQLSWKLHGKQSKGEENDEENFQSIEELQ